MRDIGPGTRSRAMASHYPYFQDPRQHPDYERRSIKVPTWETFDNTTQMTTLRTFPQKGTRRKILTDIAKTLDDYTVRYRLGRIIWPSIHHIYAENFWDLVAEIKKRDLFLFDIWGGVPGNPTNTAWGHFMPLPGMVERLRSELGDRFISFDNGEQDGRYIWSHGELQCPSHNDRFRQYCNFQHYFERMCDDLGNQMSALVSLGFGHYFVKEGNHSLLGAETAQALPNSQIYYSFIRGACKQYGILWFGNASCFNRWGYKHYDNEDYLSPGGGEPPGGPVSGSSLNLLKRLVYTHYMYNSVIVGFELGYLAELKKFHVPGFDTTGKEDAEAPYLSPIGAMQVAMGRFIEKHGRPGVMHTPVALLLDFYAGWAVPRHLYTDKVYQVWGGMPYEDGDYLTHGLLGMIYPGYEDSSYYHDERGFLSDTPYGDMADCILSDAADWVLSQYGTIVAAGKLNIDRELCDKVSAFVKGGGHFIATAENARALWPELAIGQPVAFGKGQVVAVDGQDPVKEKKTFSLCPAVIPKDAKVIAEAGGTPAAIRFKHGKGMVTVFLSPFGLNDDPHKRVTVASEVEHPLACPLHLLEHVKHILASAFTSEAIFSVGENLGYVTTRLGKGSYWLLIHNNGLKARPFKIVSRCGRILSIEEIPLDQSEKTYTGYWPKEFADNDGGTSGGRRIAGGDVRLFHVKVTEKGVRLLQKVKPPERPDGRLLALRNVSNIKEEILRHPTFFQHFDGVKIDWTYLRDRDPKRVAAENGWISRQMLQVMIDFTPGCNLFPDLSLSDFYKPDYDATVKTMSDVFAKMQLLGASDAVLSVSRIGEVVGSLYSEEKIYPRYCKCVTKICAQAEKQGVTLHFQAHPRRKIIHGDDAIATHEGILSFLNDLRADNTRLALNVGHASMKAESLTSIIEKAGDRLGVIIVCSSTVDRYGQMYDSHGSAAGNKLNLKAVTQCRVPLVLDANYRSWDEVYHDLKALEGADR